MILFCIRDSEALLPSAYANNWAEFLVSLTSYRLVDCTCATAVVILSAQRITFAMSRDKILPGSWLFKKVNGANSIPVNAALLVMLIAAGRRQLRSPWLLRSIQCDNCNNSYLPGSELSDRVYHSTHTWRIKL
jgi:hypothetical protein